MQRLELPRASRGRALDETNDTAATLSTTVSTSDVDAMLASFADATSYEARCSAACSAVRAALERIVVDNNNADNNVAVDNDAAARAFDVALDTAHCCFTQLRPHALASSRARALRVNVLELARSALYYRSRTPSLPTSSMLLASAHGALHARCVAWLAALAVDNVAALDNDVDAIDASSSSSSSFTVVAYVRLLVTSLIAAGERRPALLSLRHALAMRCAPLHFVWLELHRCGATLGVDAWSITLNALVDMPAPPVSSSSSSSSTTTTTTTTALVRHSELAVREVAWQVLFAVVALLGQFDAQTGVALRAPFVGERI